jgi:hypothetical protein
MERFSTCGFSRRGNVKSGKTIPQELKPHTLEVFNGGTKVPPLQNMGLIKGPL